MGIMINESGTLKKIGDNLRPGSVFLLDLMANTLSELGFTSEHISYTTGSSYECRKYVNSFDIGFEATFALIIPLVGGRAGGVQTPTFIEKSQNYIHNFGPINSTNDGGMFNNHTSELCFQGNSRPLHDYIKVIVSKHVKTPHTYLPSGTGGVEAYLTFELQGSKLDLYCHIYDSSSSWPDYADGYFCHDKNVGLLSAMFLVIAV